MKLKNVVYILMMFSSLMASAQTVNKVGIQTDSPSEILDVSGTVRVRSLPNNNSTTGIFTQPDGQVSTTANQPFTAASVVVANSGGVLGRTTDVPPEFFYMPSVLLPVKPTALEGTNVSFNGENEVFSINLYDVYKKQFEMGTPNSVKSVGAVSNLPVFTGSSYFDYFVTYYDNTVYEEVKITSSGILSYKVSNPDARTPRTYMNIVLKVKKL